MIDFIQSISENEIEYIANLDYGQDNEKHKVALKNLIFNQVCKSLPEQHWFPMEVIELGSYSLSKGHEKEYTICTLLLLMNVPDDINNLFESQSKTYDLLPNKYRDLIVSAYERNDS